MAEADVDPDYDADLTREFVRLRDGVYDRLRQAADVPDSRWFRVGQLLVLPSFECPYSWDVLRDPHGVYTLYRTCWRLDRDDAAFESRAERAKYPVPFVPTIETAAVPISSDDLRELLDAFRGVSIPVGVAPPASGEDGVSFELLVGDFWGGCRLRWWCDLPREWRPLQPLVRRMSDAFEAAQVRRGG
jgi:hypothetical protein